MLGDVKAVLEKRRLAAPDKVNPDLQDAALSKMERALVALADPTRDPGISAAETRATLEALVKLTGRRSGCGATAARCSIPTSATGRRTSCRHAPSGSG